MNCVLLDGFLSYIFTALISVRDTYIFTALISVGDNYTRHVDKRLISTVAFLNRNSKETSISIVNVHLSTFVTF